MLRGNRTGGAVFRGVVSLAVAAMLAAVLMSQTAVGAPAAPEQGGGKTLRVALQQADGVLPIAVGIRHGFFKKAGIGEVKITLFTSLPAMFAALAQGQVDVALQTLPALNAYNRSTSGTKLKMIAPHQMNSLVWATRVDPSIPVATKANWKSTVLAWKGKKVGVPALGGILDLYTRYMIKEAGLASGDVTIIPVGAGPPAVAALQAGLVDVITGDTLTLAILRSQGNGRGVIAFALGQGPEQLIGTQISGWIASDDAIAKDRALFTGFTQGMGQSRAFMRNSKNEKRVLDIIVRKMGYPADQAATLWEVGVPTITQQTLDQRVVGKTLQTFIATGVMSGQAPAYAFLVADFAR